MSELSARNKKCTDPTPFDRYKVPPKQNFFLMPLIWLYCFFATRSGHLKIHRKNMERLKPPFIVFGSHHAWMDFYVTPLALFPHRANYVSEMEGFEFFGEWAYRQIGCLGTRKFVNDIALVRNIKRCMERKGIVVIYPEARYANVGTSSELPASVGKLAKNLGVSVQTAAGYIRRYFERYPKVQTYLKESVERAKERGYAETLFKRKRPLPELSASNYNVRQFGERVAMNMPIQGTAADIIKIAMVHVDRALKDGGFKARLVLQIHDELLVDTPREEAEQVMKLMQNAMEGVASLSVRLVAEAKCGESWYETK